MGHESSLLNKKKEKYKKNKKINFYFLRAERLFCGISANFHLISSSSDDSALSSLVLEKYSDSSDPSSPLLPVSTSSPLSSNT
jgi:hypothetical protein